MTEQRTSNVRREIAEFFAFLCGAGAFTPEQMRLTDEWLSKRIGDAETMECGEDWGRMGEDL